MKNLLKDSNAYYENNDYYEIFSIAEDAENKVAKYLNNISKKKTRRSYQNICVKNRGFLGDYK